MADLRNTRLSVYFRRRLLDGFGMTDWNAALIRIYGGAQPATPETAVGAQVLAVTNTFGNPAFGASDASAIVTANAITAGVAVASVNPVTWARVLTSDLANVLMDFEIGANTDANTDNLELPTTNIVANVSVGITGFTFTLPMQGL